MTIKFPTWPGSFPGLFVFLEDTTDYTYTLAYEGQLRRSEGGDSGGEFSKRMRIPVGEAGQGAPISVPGLLDIDEGRLHWKLGP